MSHNPEPKLIIQVPTPTLENPTTPPLNIKLDSIDTPNLQNHGITLSIPGSKTSTTSITEQPKRRVSIASDPISEQNSRHAYDNPSYERNPSRKVSQSSMHSHTDIGPVRKKSILVSPSHDNESLYSHTSQHSYDNRHNGGKGLNTQTALDSLHDKLNEHHTDNSTPNNQIEQSWIYLLCLRCRTEDNKPSWSPPHWEKVCPYPLCPTFRQFSRFVTLVLIGALIWITAYVIIGDSAAPGGELFQLVVLTVAAHFGGWLISLTTLPRLIGMLLVGIIFQLCGWIDLDGSLQPITVQLRKCALTLILIRAGLEMEPEAFKKVWKTILKLGVIPWLVECCVIGVMSHFLLGLPWIWGFLLGSIISAVSPAVVVPCLYRLRTKGYGVAKGIPTLVIAVAGIDDALSVATFGIISSIMFHSDDVPFQISQAPVCIIGGLAFGVLWGQLSRFIPEKGDPYVVPLRTILLFTGGLVAIFGSHVLDYEGAGPLAVVFSAFVANKYWCEQGWDIEDNPVTTAFEIFWMIFEPILFGITGATIKLTTLDPTLVGLCSACIVVSSIIRILCTAGIAFGDNLNIKEKFFVGICWMSKATVQAALGPVALRVVADKSDDEKNYAAIIQTAAILSICLTAPLGAILITITGTKLLTKTRHLSHTDGWRRSHRPSIRDISIIDEEEEREDPEISQTKENKNKLHPQSITAHNNNPQTFTYNN